MELDTQIEFTGIKSNITQYFSENGMSVSPNILAKDFKQMIEKAYNGVNSQRLRSEKTSHRISLIE